MIAEAGRPVEHPRGIAHGSELFVVDDDGWVRNLLSAILPLEGFPVTCFDDGETFLAAARSRMPVCVFLDVAMPGRSGLAILNELTAMQYQSPVFLLTDHEHVLMEDFALENGARGFLRKPFDPYAAVERVREAVEFWQGRVEDHPKRAALDPPGQIRLTARESQVLAHVIRGLSSKDIADELGLGKRTVDDMRMKTMKKLGAKNAAGLVRLVMNVV